MDYGLYSHLVSPRLNNCIIHVWTVPDLRTDGRRPTLLPHVTTSNDHYISRRQIAFDHLEIWPLALPQQVERE